MDIKETTTQIGHKNLAGALGCGETAISNAVKRGHFPASWFKVVTRLGNENGIAVPDSLFNFKSPDSGASK